MLSDAIFYGKNQYPALRAPDSVLIVFTFETGGVSLDVGYSSMTISNTFEGYLVSPPGRDNFGVVDLIQPPLSSESGIGGWERFDLKLPEVGLPDGSLVSVENPTTVLLNPRQHFNNPREAFGKTAECAGAVELLRAHISAAALDCRFDLRQSIVVGGGAT